MAQHEALIKGKSKKSFPSAQNKTPFEIQAHIESSQWIDLGHLYLIDVGYYKPIVCAL